MAMRKSTPNMTRLWGSGSDASDFQQSPSPIGRGCPEGVGEGLQVSQSVCTTTVWNPSSDVRVLFQNALRHLLPMGEGECWSGSVMLNISHILQSSPRRREPSCERSPFWVPACAGMIGLVLVACSEVTAAEVPKPIACLPEGGKSPFDTVLVTFKSGAGTDRPAEVNYGSDYRSGTYYSSEEKHFIKMPKNGLWLECYMTVYRLTGFAKHYCVATDDKNKKLAEKSTYDLSCKKTERKF